MRGSSASSARARDSATPSGRERSEPSRARERALRVQVELSDGLTVVLDDFGQLAAAFEEVGQVNAHFDRVFFGARFAIHARAKPCTGCAETARTKAKATAARSTPQTASDLGGARGSGPRGGANPRSIRQKDLFVPSLLEQHGPHAFRK